MKTMYILGIVGVILMVGTKANAQEVQHFVAFRFKSTVSPETRAEVRRRFFELKRSTRDGKPYIMAIEGGDADSPEGLDQGMQQAYVVTFRSKADRDYYVGKPKFDPFDPAHDAFKQFVGPLLETDSSGRAGVYVFDYVKLGAR